MTRFRAAVLGGVDGIITSFAIVAGAHSGSLSTQVVLLIGLSSLVADGLSMGISEFLSTQASREANPIQQGLVCFASFVVNGVVPIVTYVAVRGVLLSVAMFSLVQLMLLGVLRSWYTSEHILVGLLQTSLLGGIAGTAAYGVGTLVDHGS